MCFLANENFPAAREARIVLTFDKDFGELAWRAGLPASSGIVLLRLPMPPVAEVGTSLAPGLLKGPIGPDISPSLNSAYSHAPACSQCWNSSARQHGKAARCPNWPRPPCGCCSAHDFQCSAEFVIALLASPGLAVLVPSFRPIIPFRDSHLLRTPIIPPTRELSLARLVASAASAPDEP
jgi:hypothetical protein